jgi:hypothetical protein
MMEYIRINTPEGEAKLAAYVIESGAAQTEPPILALQNVLFTDGAPVSMSNPIAMLMHRAPNARVKRFTATNTTTFTLLEANADRHQYKIRTGPAALFRATLYIKDGPGCTPTDYSDYFEADGRYETGLAVYTGIVTACWSGVNANSSVQVTELY